MPHVRKQIRDAIHTLVTGLTTTGSAAYASRVYPFDTLPCVAVYTLDEEVNQEQETIGERIVRDLDVMIEGRAKVHSEAASPVDDVLDSIAEEVEVAVAADVTVGGLCTFIEIQSTNITLDDSEEQPTGLVRMRWRAQYATISTDPTVSVS